MANPICYVRSYWERAGWKRDLGRILVFNPSELDYHEGFLEWLTGEHSRDGSDYLGYYFRQNCG